MSRFWQKENPINTDDIGIAKDIKKSSIPYQRILSNILWICGSIALIIGSFWLSFLMGRRILVPIKQQPQKVQEIRKIIPLKEPIVSEPIKEKVTSKNKIQPLIKQKVNIKRIVIPVAKKISIKKESPVITDSLYRVQIAQLYDKDAAIGLMKELQKKEFDVFARDSGNGKWYVQIGAFKDKIKARKVIADLKSKGLENQLVIKEEK